jgi:putative ABC transport system substrate-binding protein
MEDHMNRKVFGLVFSAMLLALCVCADAQQPAKMPRIGYLTGTSLSVASARTDAFRQGLRDAGYIEGKNIVIEWRSWEGKPDRQRPFAADLVKQKVDVIVAVGAGDVRVAREATSTIPIVMVTPGDPVGSGFVASLERPGGNITGMASPRAQLSGKQLEALKEILPKLSRIAVFASPGQQVVQIQKGVESAAGKLGVKVQRHEIKNLKDIESAFQTSVKEKAEGVVMLVSGPLLNPNRKEVAALAVKNRMPTTYPGSEDVEAGGLMSYGVNGPDLYRRAATFVDKILRGAKPADLPVEQAQKFDLVINLKAAQQIGLNVPEAMLKRADKVIK